MLIRALPHEDSKLSLAEEILRSGTGLRLKARGMSMLPTIWPGDHLFIESLTSKRIEAGDIALVVRSGRFFIHRVVDKSGRGWILRGDALPQPDPWTENDGLLGRVILIEHNGLIRRSDRRRSLLNRALGWIFGRWDPARNIALRIQSFPSHKPASLSGIERFELAPGDAGF